MFLTNLVPTAVVASAVAPALLLLWLAVAADSRPEPPRVVLTAVAFGALAALVVGVVETVLTEIPVSAHPLLGTIETTLFFVAIPEETAKIAIIAWIALRSRDFDEPMDGVVYGTAVGLGFAALENIFYLAGDADWALLAIMRGLLTVPFHGALGAIAGAYIARARFGGALGANSRDHYRRPRLLLLAWLIPVVLHAAFDTATFSLANSSDLGALAFLLLMAVVSIGAIVFAVRLARLIAHRQKAWMQTKRLPARHWRLVWARTLIGLGLSFLGATLAISGVASVSLVGCVVMAIAIGISWNCRKRLTEAAKLAHRAHAVSPAPVAPASPAP
jgi:RsiW-degrading membrane proteinase PrsW (M82 family)